MMMMANCILVLNLLQRVFSAFFRFWSTFLLIYWCPLLLFLFPFLSIFLTFIKFYLIKYLHSHVCMFMFLSTYVACCVSRGQRTLELDCLFVIWNLRMDSLGKSLLKWKKSTGRLRRLMSETVLDPTWYGMCMPSSSLKRMLRRLWTNT